MPSQAARKPARLGYRQVRRIRPEETPMHLSAPKQITFIVAVVIGVLAIIGTQTSIPFFTPNAFWALAAAFVILAVGNLARGL